ncbi:MAG TPA: DUF5926 family protein [Micromonosporaceae bacterium]|nr:DUF5926 family protein [Micromonosporaceae bacterium]
MSKRRKASAQRSGAPARSAKVRDVFVARPFEGLVDEAEWIALRELVPAATAPLTLAPRYAEQYGDRSITVATVLPMAWPALTKPDGRVLVGLQRNTHSGDASRDVALAVLLALEAEPGTSVTMPVTPGPGERLQDVLADVPLDVTVRDGFEFWLDDEATEDPDVRASLERANASVYPTVRMAAARGAYWCRVPDRAHLRWVLADDEDAALNTLARLQAGGDLTLGDATKFAGMFRAHGRLVPVWDLPERPAGEEWEQPFADFVKRYADAFAAGGELTSDERRARQGLIGRQVTLR